MGTDRPQHGKTNPNEHRETRTVSDAITPAVEGREASERRPDFTPDLLAPRTFAPTSTSARPVHPSAPHRTTRRRRHRIDDAVLDSYLRRIDPAVAASFTPVQREALKTMLGARERARHLLEIRRSIPFGRRWFYIVFLIGAERRSLARLYREGAVSRPFATLVYLVLATLFATPLFILFAVNSG